MPKLPRMTAPELEARLLKAGFARKPLESSCGNVTPPEYVGDRHKLGSKKKGEPKQFECVPAPQKNDPKRKVREKKCGDRNPEEWPPQEAFAGTEYDPKK